MSGHRQGLTRSLLEPARSEDSIGSALDYEETEYSRLTRGANGSKLHDIVLEQSHLVNTITDNTGIYHGDFELSESSLTAPDKNATGQQQPGDGHVDENSRYFTDPNSSTMGRDSGTMGPNSSTMGRDSSTMGHDSGEYSTSHLYPGDTQKVSNAIIDTQLRFIDHSNNAQLLAEDILPRRNRRQQQYVATISTPNFDMEKIKENLRLLSELQSGLPEPHPQDSVIKEADPPPTHNSSQPLPSAYDAPGLTRLDSESTTSSEDSSSVVGEQMLSAYDAGSPTRLDSEATTSSEDTSSDVGEQMLSAYDARSPTRLDSESTTSSEDTSSDVGEQMLSAYDAGSPTRMDIDSTTSSEDTSSDVGEQMLSAYDARSPTMLDIESTTSSENISSDVGEQMLSAYDARSPTMLDIESTTSSENISSDVGEQMLSAYDARSPTRLDNESTTSSENISRVFNEQMLSVYDARSPTKLDSESTASSEDTSSDVDEQMLSVDDARSPTRLDSESTPSSEDTSSDVGEQLPYSHDAGCSPRLDGESKALSKDISRVFGAQLTFSHLEIENSNIGTETTFIEIYTFQETRNLTFDKLTSYNQVLETDPDKSDSESSDKSNENDCQYNLTMEDGQDSHTEFDQTPVDDQNYPQEIDATPVDDQKKPTALDQSPVDDQTYPQEIDPTSVDDQKKQTARDQSPVDDHNYPQEIYPTTVDDQNNFTQFDQTTVDDHNYPQEIDPTPVDDQKNQTVCDQSPVDDQTYPQAIDPAPVDDQNTFTQLKQTTVHDQNYPQAFDQTPVDDQKNQTARDQSPVDDHNYPQEIDPTTVDDQNNFTQLDQTTVHDQNYPQSFDQTPVDDQKNQTARDQSPVDDHNYPQEIDPAPVDDQNYPQEIDQTPVDDQNNFTYLDQTHGNEEKPPTELCQIPIDGVNNSAQIGQTQVPGPSNSTQKDQTPVDGQSSSISISQSPVDDLSSSIPISQSPVDDQSSSIPISQSPIDDQNSSIPISQSPVDDQNSSIPIRQSPVDDQSSSIPISQSPIDDQNSSIPISQSPVDDQNSSIPIRQSPVDDQSSPIPVSQSPVDDQSSSIPVSQSPVDDQSSSIPVSQSPVDDQSTSIPISQSPVDDQNSSKPVSQSPVDDQKSSIPISQSPVDDQNISIPISQSPVDDQSSSIPVSQSPVEDQSSSIPVSQSSVDDQSSSIPVSQSPVDDQSSSIPVSQPPVDDQSSSIPVSQSHTEGQNNEINIDQTRPEECQTDPLIHIQQVHGIRSDESEDGESCTTMFGRIDEYDCTLFPQLFESDTKNSFKSDMTLFPEICNSNTALCNVFFESDTTQSGQLCEHEESYTTMFGRIDDSDVKLFRHLSECDTTPSSGSYTTASFQTFGSNISILGEEDFDNDSELFEKTFGSDTYDSDEVSIQMPDDQSGECFDAMDTNTRGSSLNSDGVNIPERQYFDGHNTIDDGHKGTDEPSTAFISVHNKSKAIEESKVKRGKTCEDEISGFPNYGPRVETTILEKNYRLLSALDPFRHVNQLENNPGHGLTNRAAAIDMLAEEHKNLSKSFHQLLPTKKTADLANRAKRKNANTIIKSDTELNKTIQQLNRHLNVTKSVTQSKPSDKLGRSSFEPTSFSQYKLWRNVEHDVEEESAAPGHTGEATKMPEYDRRPAIVSPSPHRNDPPVQLVAPIARTKSTPVKKKRIATKREPSSETDVNRPKPRIQRLCMGFSKVPGKKGKKNTSKSDAGRKAGYLPCPKVAPVAHPAPLQLQPLKPLRERVFSTPLSSARVLSKPLSTLTVTPPSKRSIMRAYNASKPLGTSSSWQQPRLETTVPKETPPKLDKTSLPTWTAQPRNKMVPATRNASTCDTFTNKKKTYPRKEEGLFDLCKGISRSRPISTPGPIPKPGSIPNTGLISKHGPIPNTGTIPNTGPIPNPGLIPNTGPIPNPELISKPGHIPNPGLISKPGHIPNTGPIPNPCHISKPGHIPHVATTVRDVGARGESGEIKHIARPLLGRRYDLAHECSDIALADYEFDANESLFLFPQTFEYSIEESLSNYVFRKQSSESTTSLTSLSSCGLPSIEWSSISSDLFSSRGSGYGLSLGESSVELLAKIGRWCLLRNELPTTAQRKKPEAKPLSRDPYLTEADRCLRGFLNWDPVITMHQCKAGGLPELQATIGVAVVPSLPIPKEDLAPAYMYAMPNNVPEWYTETCKYPRKYNPPPIRSLCDPVSKHVLRPEKPLSSPPSANIQNTTLMRSSSCISLWDPSLPCNCGRKHALSSNTELFPHHKETEPQLPVPTTKQKKSLKREPMLYPDGRYSYKGNIFPTHEEQKKTDHLFTTSEDQQKIDNFFATPIRRTEEKSGATSDHAISESFSNAKACALSLLYESKNMVDSDSEPESVDAPEPDPIPEPDTNVMPPKPETPERPPLIHQREGEVIRESVSTESQSDPRVEPATIVMPPKRVIPARRSIIPQREAEVVASGPKQDDERAELDREPDITYPAQDGEVAELGRVTGTWNTWTSWGTPQGPSSVSAESIASTSSVEDHSRRMSETIDNTWASNIFVKPSKYNTIIFMFSIGICVGLASAFVSLPVEDTLMEYWVSMIAYIWRNYMYGSLGPVV